MFIYNFAIQSLRFGAWVASFFDPKARAFTAGRRNLFTQLQTTLQSNASPLIWIHCSSLGEFEQGRPIMEAIKKEYPNHKLLLSFFSPSGFEVRKNYPGADFIFYLPFDTPSNAKRWIEVTQPVLVIFVKYEFWLNYSTQLRKRNIPLISISGIFRPNQIYFKPHVALFRSILKNFNHFFVQNSSSVKLLRSIGIEKVTLAGDTRFDRVYEITSSKESIPIAEKFKADDKLMVVGSCWPEDMEVLVPFINETQLKFIIAPHEISGSFLQKIEESLKVKVVRYSRAGSYSNLEEYHVLLIDNIGMLSRLYRYGEFAYVGGAFGKGLHNILEAACYGVPIFFGNRNFYKSSEAHDLIKRGGAFEIRDFIDLKEKYETVTLPENFLPACEVTRFYVEENLGATEKIMKYCRTVLKQ